HARSTLRGRRSSAPVPLSVPRTCRAPARCAARRLRSIPSSSFRFFQREKVVPDHVLELLGNPFRAELGFGLPLVAGDHFVLRKPALPRRRSRLEERGAALAFADHAF